MGEHIPVLLHETIDGLNIKKDGTYLDLTIGRGGPSSAILSQLTTGRLIGFDQDEDVSKESTSNLSKVIQNFELIHSKSVSNPKTLNMLMVS